MSPKKTLLGLTLIAVGVWLILPIENVLGIHLFGYSGIALKHVVNFFIALMPLLFVIAGILTIWIELKAIKSEVPKE